MGQPPRLPEVRLPWEKRIIYFVTLCVKDRQHVLANAILFEAATATIARLRRWRVLAGVIMPDHAHWIVSPIGDRERSVGDFSDGFKRVLRKTLASQKWEWQRGCLDRLLRSDENLHSKWIYVDAILCGMVWCKEQTIGHTIWISLTMKKIICRDGLPYRKGLRSGEASSFSYRADSADGVPRWRRGVVTL
jgi:REP element-mobilizing transposase RayT